METQCRMIDVKQTPWYAQEQIQTILLVFFTVFTGHAWLVYRYGSSIPYMDQWDGEALRIYLPALEGTLNWSSFFRPHNEHRIVFTHLENLLLFKAIGSWDPLAQMLVNAALYAATIALLCRLITRELARAESTIAVGLITLIGIAPFGWQNSLWGFQSQNYYAMLFSSIAIFGLIESAGSKRWWAGSCAAFFSIIANGSGPLCGFAVFSALIGIGILKLRPWASLTSSMSVAGLVMMVGILSANHLGTNNYLHSQSLATFAKVTANGLAWPNIDQPFAAVVAWLPCIVLAITVAIGRVGSTRNIWVCLAVGAMAALHAFAIAYARGGGLYDAAPLSRYQDVLAFGAVANGFALLLLRADAQLLTRRHMQWKLLTGIWIAFFAIGMIELTLINGRLHLPFKVRYDGLGKVNLTTYIAIHDPQVLLNKSYVEIAGSSEPVLRRVLDEPRLRPYLPPELTSPPRAPSAPEKLVRNALSVSPWAFIISIICLVGRLAKYPLIKALNRSSTPAEHNVGASP